MKAELGRMKAENEMKDLKTRTREFALRIVRLYCALPKTTEAQVLGKQFLHLSSLRLSPSSFHPEVTA